MDSLLQLCLLLSVNISINSPNDSGGRSFSALTLYPSPCPGAPVGVHLRGHAKCPDSEDLSWPQSRDWMAARCKVANKKKVCHILSALILTDWSIDMNKHDKMQIDFLPLWINEPQISAYQTWGVTSFRARVRAERSDSLSHSIKKL